jgi:hypothetical protein
VDVGLDAFVEGFPVKNAGKNLFHGGVSLLQLRQFHEQKKASFPSGQQRLGMPLTLN